MRRAPKRPAGPRGARAGVATLEFGMVLPVLVFLLLGILEFAVYGVTAATLDMGLRQASRFGALGSTAPAWMINPPASRQDVMKRIILRYGGSLFVADKLTIVPTVRAGTGTAAADPSDRAGGAGQIVAYRAEYRQALLPLGKLLFRGRNIEGSSIVHTSTTVVRNEPFSS